ncbi:MAG TPA: hypothetical protein VHQ64_20215 [Pyrinomonadaceae bacterium]|jgi:hypothetical protein|nr:hypothetical protein [Pyrinomonadaceae bacterium]
MIRALIVIVFTSMLSISTAAMPPFENDDCGAAVDGLQMCLAASGSNLQLTLGNVGDHDITVNLGIMLANGKVQLPDRVMIKFTDAQGKARVFKFSDFKYGAIAGRVDHYLVPLRVGSTYTLQLRLDQFWCQETKEFSIPLLAGENRLTAQFQGTSATQVNLDMGGVALMNFWLGKAESNTLTLLR